MTRRAVARLHRRAYARATEAGRRCANSPPRGTGEQASGTTAIYPAALPTGPFGAPNPTEGSTMRNDQRMRR